MKEFTTWEDVLENGTIEDLYNMAETALDEGFPVPVDVMARLHSHGYWID